MSNKKTGGNWWQGAVFYQIYPRSFMDSTGNGVGDIKGITQNLEYVASLGVDAIWISPVFKSPMKDFGYDISDYRDIDPLFGCMADFDALLKKAHALDLKIIIDLVLNHTSDQHPWFSDESKKDWYVWADAKPDIFEKRVPPNNWVSVFGGSAWEWNETHQQYYFHNFLKEQPDLNYHNPDVQGAALDICKFWLERGVDGLRLDVINFLFHDPELRDNPPKDPEIDGYATQLEKPDPYNDQHHIYDKSRPEAFPFIRRMRALLDQYPCAMTLAEIGDDNAVKCAAQYTTGDKHLHTAYNFSLMTGDTVTASKVKNAIESQYAQKGNGWPSWAFSNHDVTRAASRWLPNNAPKPQALEFSKMLIALLCSLRGTIFLYQGEELGLPEAQIAFEDLQDPWGKHHWPQWPGRDGCRTPIPWNDKDKHAGFTSTDKPWLPIPEAHKALCIKTQEADEDSTLIFIRKFLKWRKTKPVLISGNIEFIETNDEELLIFKRTTDNHSILCAFNLGTNDKIYETGNQAITLPPYAHTFIE